MEPKLEPKLDLCAVRTPYFHPWVDKVAQVVPNDAQSASKGAQRLSKWSQNAAPGVQHVGPKLFQKGGFPLSYIYVYIYIYTCSDKGDRKASQRTIAHDRK